ncbi:MAG: mannose-6-phosphate isomerase, partial [Gammaproteobacteria bacterium]|nr:mannose-6-phosphate isomerase [Gammaproteobacteria bacterium]
HVFVPKGNKHRIENIGKTLLTIVEVQLGDYFGEDDIIRYDDDFERHI